MSHFHYWYPLIGVLLLLVVLSSATVRRAPISIAIIYLVIGWGFGRLGWLTLDIGPHGEALETLAEIAVIVSLFSAGLKLRKSLRSHLWRVPLFLASASMVTTVALVAICGAVIFDVPIGLAILLGAILAPTDPVLASEVQVSDPGDTDSLRFTLTGEAGLNDGAAFPFVMLGLGLLGLHELGTGTWRWWTTDVLWAIAGGLANGGAFGQGSRSPGRVPEAASSASSRIRRFSGARAYRHFLRHCRRLARVRIPRGIRSGVGPENRGTGTDGAGGSAGHQTGAGDGRRDRKRPATRASFPRGGSAGFQ